MKLLVATTNPGKISELRSMIERAQVGVEAVGLSDVGDFTEVVEDGESFAENARKKAVGYSKQSGLWTVADDSGLVVDALDGKPGVKSARFSGEKSDDRSLIDHKNIAKVLELMKDVPFEKRTARFVCSLCLADGDKVLLETNGICEGIITEAEKGENGFGYDPVMYIPGHGKTMGEMSAEEKNSISHRGKALRRLADKLAVIMDEDTGSW